MRIIKIFGPPGTGKTTTLISTLKKELQDGIAAKDVAFLSHTVAAVEEAKSRTLAQFSELDLKEDLCWFRTMHSICFNLLGLRLDTNSMMWVHYKEFSEITGYTVTGKTDTEAILEQDVLEDTWDLVLTARSIASHRMCSIDDIMGDLPDDPKLHPDSRKRFLDEWESYKKKHSRFDFTDQLEKYYYEDHGFPRIKVMFLDEAQDLSKLQWAIVNKLCPTVERLYIAGDDDQSIYKFMGSDEYGFLDHKCDQEILLTKSYRCSPKIGSRADKIIKQVGRRKSKKVNWTGGEGEIKYVPSIDRVDWDTLSGVETMVLARHTRQCWDIKKHLERRGLSSSVKGKSVTTNEFVKSIETYLRMRFEGKAYRPHMICHIMKRVGINADMVKGVREIGRRDGKRLMTADQVPELDWTTKRWPNYLSRNSKEYRIFLELQKVLNRSGLDIIGEAPNIDIMTYHAAKGKEADNLILFTDIYPIVHQAMIDDPTQELRLAYVGITRAKRDVIIVLPETNYNMRALLER